MYLVRAVYAPRVPIHPCSDHAFPYPLFVARPFFSQDAGRCPGEKIALCRIENGKNKCPSYRS